MTQQLQQYPTYGQSQYRQQSQMGPQSQQSSQAGAQSFSSAVPNEIVTAAADLDRLATVSEWAHVQAMNAGAAQPARICSDVHEIAELQKQLLVAQSPFAQPIGEATTKVLQNAIQQLQQYSNIPGIQETVEASQRTVSTIQNALARLQTFTGANQQFGSSRTTSQSGQFGAAPSVQPFGQSAVPQTSQAYGQSMAPQTSQSYGQSGFPQTGQPYGQSMW